MTDYEMLQAINEVLGTDYTSLDDIPERRLLECLVVILATVAEAQVFVCDRVTDYMEVRE